jgi:hypothetical protein
MFGQHESRRLRRPEFEKCKRTALYNTVDTVTATIDEAPRYHVPKRKIHTETIIINRRKSRTEPSKRRKPGERHTSGRKWIVISKQLVQSSFQEKVPAVGVGSGAVRGESVLVGGLKGCYWSKAV